MFDTHCHIHDTQYPFDGQQVLQESREAGVEQLVCVGTTAKDSQLAADFASANGVLASAAQHPHDAEQFGEQEQKMIRKLVEDGHVHAIGECGLDYYYENSPKVAQQQALRWHLRLAEQSQLPLLFHIRDAFDDFWPIFDEFSGLSGVVHCFTANTEELNHAVDRGLYVAFNGIMTFTTDAAQLAALDAAPLDRIVLETDAPFLTPAPLRGKVNMPHYLEYVAEFIAKRKNISKEELIAITTCNAKQLLLT